MSGSPHPLLTALRQDLANGPIVVAHRGDSEHHPENTLPAFASARQLGVAMQEFDVRATRDHQLVCIHDASVDRTTNGARLLGPGALLVELSWDEVRTLDAGSWRSEAHRGLRLPRLDEALAAMLPDCVPLIEHKAGDVGDYLAVLASMGATERCILQSFDWQFVAAAHAAAPRVALAVLGPTRDHPTPNAAAITAAVAAGAGVMHWRDRGLGQADVDRIHDAGLLVCTYTTDDEIGWRGGASLGFDAMCTNRCHAMTEVRRSGQLRRYA